MRPFEDFQLRNAVFASIWLVLMAPLLVQVYTSDGVSTGAKTWTTMCVLGFGLFYFWAFGTMSTHPRGWGLFPRAMLRWGILLAIALASVPVIKTGAVIFAPYLATVVGFTLPWKKALPIMLATGTVGVIAVWLSAPTHLGWAAFTLFFIPLVLIGVGAFSQHDESRQQLQHELELAQQRERIAADVHDLLGHSLTVINLKSEVARRAADKNSEQAKQELQEISELTRFALAEVRSTVTRMRTPTFAGELQAARRALETRGITPHLPERLTSPGKHDTVFSWGLRELTTNVVRHSGAHNCWVSITGNRLQVTDDGCGFSSDISQNTGGGLAGLRERVEAAGGQLVLRREQGVSTALITMDGTEEETTQ